MRWTGLLAVLVAIDTTFAAGNASIVTGNPIDVIYTATLPTTPFFNAPGLDGNIRGYISATAPSNGVGVRFTVRFANLPKTGGPFAYHLHVKRATGGDCSATGAHLDPTDRGEKPRCDSNIKSSCQVGDLSGKHGTINSDPFVAEYVDKYASLQEGDPAFFGKRSFVIHLANSTRVTCADFVRNQARILRASPSNGNSSCTCSPNSTTTIPSTGTISPTASRSSGNYTMPLPSVVLSGASAVAPGLMAGWIFMTVLLLGAL